MMYRHTLNDCVEDIGDSCRKTDSTLLRIDDDTVGPKMSAVARMPHDNGL